MAQASGGAPARVSIYLSDDQGTAYKPVLEAGWAASGSVEVSQLGAPNVFAEALRKPGGTRGWPGQRAAGAGMCARPPGDPEQRLTTPRTLPGS